MVRATLSATLRFTDIVGSTEELSRLGDRRWRARLEDHDQIIREALRRWRGREIKTFGDGFLATFDGPARALSCAGDIVAALHQRDLALRIGLHTGECEVRPDDVSGIAVHIASRVMRAAGPGEVLASSTVKELVVGSGLRFEDPGRACAARRRGGVAPLRARSRAGGAALRARALTELLVEPHPP
ncbi:MAG TPA: adenylate/guanylate cyclase domain-containing protein [Solirubrobacteraceae bacterium]|nr:adenylate/guanylate cyclase domain-containing protein [Solirubrobacteraceae bacterium]